MKKNIIILSIIVVLLAVFIIWGYLRQGAQDPGTIKIGFIGPITGDGAVYGVPLNQIAQLAVDEINQKGGIGGKLMEIIFEDGKCSGQDGATAAQKLINVDKVKVITTLCSNESLAALPIAEAAKVAIISPGANSMELSGKSPFFFRIYPTVTAEGLVFANLAYGQDKRKVAFISEQDDFTQGVYKAFTTNFTRLGGKVIKEEFLPGTRDFKTPLTKLKKQNPDVLFINPLNPNTGNIILKQIKEMGWKIQLIINDPMTGEPFLADNKDLLEGAWASEFKVDPTNSKFQHVIKAYKDKYGSDVPYQSFAQTEYDVVYLIKDAIKAVGYDGEKIAAWGHSIKDWQGASGLITIDSNGDRVGGSVAEIIRGGKLEKIK
ncbi:MAG: ABC transporter substrate-binding protein [Candidatus Paceibacterota bacterium]